MHQPKRSQPKTEHLTAKEAAATLGVSLPTLYAYVSRGLLRSLPGPEGTRQRRYAREDLLAIRERQMLHRAPREALDHALQWGAPLLESSLVQIRDGTLFYRERDAVELARSSTLEQVAQFLWTGDLGLGLSPPKAHALLAEVGKVAQALPPMPFVDRYATLLPVAASQDEAAWDLRPEGMVATGARILWFANRLAGGRGSGGLAGALARGFYVADAVSLISQALVLCAEHELNVSSFTARCVASAGSTPWHAVQAGLAALVGTRHGGQSLQAEALVAEVETEGALPTLSARLRRGETIPGFGHPLYPDGDPRGRALVEAVVALGGPFSKLVSELRAAGADLLGAHPTVDLGLALACRAVGVPRGTSLTLFALGRTVGWVAHAIEQQASGALIRPRARYSGGAGGR